MFSKENGDGRSPIDTAVVTTRRVLERLAVHYVSQRMAWKLLKDVPKSAARKAQRGMPSMIYFCSVTKTTCRGLTYLFNTLLLGFT
ncbi:hypothetical protein MTR67_019410 [Solanum verrucosum]|uniref:Uncharacterized protein n=1 Tax=Solanum verrucosum TaxID=315347 RepID=A0AAF0QRS7_SOLVR|nr:hypothetical protein MTR67_019410 [Solanum verrucosum]